MKRVISIACAAILLASVFCLAGCGGGSIDGSYTLVEFTVDGEDNMSELRGATITLDVKGNTAIISGMKELNGDDDQELAVNTEKKTLTDATGSSASYRTEGNRLIVEPSGIRLVFEKRGS